MFDDVYTSENRGSTAMNRIFSSGRHWLISCCTLCVSWTDIIPSCRRALDFVILYSNITTNDTQFLTRNFLHRSLIEPARYALQTNSLYTGLVIVTNPKQKLYLMKFKKKKLDAKLKYREKECHSNEIALRQDNMKSLVGSVGNEEKVSGEKKLLMIWFRSNVSYHQGYSIYWHFYELLCDHNLIIFCGCRNVLWISRLVEKLKSFII